MNGNDAKVKSAKTTPLYEGAEITIFQSYLLLVQFSIHYGLSASGFNDLLHLLTNHLSKSAKLLNTVHALKKFPFLMMLQELILHVLHAYNYLTGKMLFATPWDVSIMELFHFSLCN